MTIGIKSNLVVSLNKKKWQLVLFQFFRYLCFTGISGNLAETLILKDIFIFLANDNWFCVNCFVMCFTGISENLAETPILKDIFIFLANGHCFQKLQFLVDIVSFLREVFSVFEKCQFLVALFPFGKKCHFYAKSVSFWPNKWIFKYSDKIISCKHQFLCKTVNFGKKKIEFREKCWFFQTIVHYYWKWTSYWKTCLFSENCDFLCDCLYKSRNCRILIKTLIFLRKCLFVHVSIFIKVFYLLENCYFDSKYHFIRWYFGQKCHW